MAALRFGQTQVSGRNTSTRASVRNDNLSKLKYYLSCVNSVLADSPLPFDVTNYIFGDTSYTSVVEVVRLAYLYGPLGLEGLHCVSSSQPQLKGDSNVCRPTVLPYARTPF